MNSTNKTIKKLKSGIIFLMAITIVIAMIWRIQCSISYYDEVYNIYVSFRTAALGQRHLVENGNVHSMGDLFNLPFVYLFYTVTKGTEGIVLFIRFVYLGYNLVLSCVFYKVLKGFYGKKEMALFGLILISLVPGGLYTVSYDTMPMFFSLLGNVLLFASEIRGTEKTGIYRYWGGVCHACMVYSYPLMAGVILVLLVGLSVFHVRIERMKVKKLVKYWLPYFLGGMTVLGIFLIYVLSVGWENIFIFKRGFVQEGLRDRQVGELAVAVEKAENPIFIVVKKIAARLYTLLVNVWHQQKAALGYTVILLIQWGIGLVKKGKWRLFLIPEIILVAFFTHGGIRCFAGTSMYAYCFCWVPFLFFYLEKGERRQGVIMLLIFGLTSIAAFLAIGFTSLRVNSAHCGFYCGAICSFLFMIMIVRKEVFEGDSIAIGVILLIALCNIGMAYRDHFQGADIWECTYRMQKGIFKGIMTWEEDKEYEKLKECFEKISFSKNATIAITSNNCHSIALDSGVLIGFNLLQSESMLQAGKGISEVYEEIYWPELVLVDKEEEINYVNVTEKILKRYYELACSGQKYNLYIREIEK